MLTVQERVANGVMLLDMTIPGWYKKINLDDLCITSISYCILGQLYGEYDNGCIILDFGEIGLLSSQTTKEMLTKRHNHGFTTHKDIGGTIGGNTLDLTREWKLVIQRRLRNDKYTFNRSNSENQKLTETESCAV